MTWRDKALPREEHLDGYGKPCSCSSENKLVPTTTPKVSIVLVVVTMITVAYLKMHEKPPEAAFTGRWVTCTVIFLTMNFVLTLLMILKRIYIMLNQTLDKPFISKRTA